MPLRKKNLKKIPIINISILYCRSVTVFYRFLENLPKNMTYRPKIVGEKKCSKSVSGYVKTKSKKKCSYCHQAEGGGMKALVSGTATFFEPGDFNVKILDLWVKKPI